MKHLKFLLFTPIFILFSIYAFCASPTGQGLFIVPACSSITSPVTNFSYCFVGANIDYWKLVDDSSADERFKFSFKVGSQPIIPNYSYNWPYDYFSLVELIKIEAGYKVESDKAKEDNVKQKLNQQLNLGVTKNQKNVIVQNLLGTTPIAANIKTIGNFTTNKKNNK